MWVAGPAASDAGGNGDDSALRNVEGSGFSGSGFSSPQSPKRLCGWQERPRMTQVAIATTALQDVRGLRRELLPWIAYHLHLGIAHFYVSSPA